MDVLQGFMVLLLAQFAGEVLHRVVHVPLPGPVIGMALLAAALLLRKGEPSAGLVQTSDGLLRWMGLLFVPAGVGIFANLGVLYTSFVPVVVSLVVSSLLTFAVTAWVMQALGRGAAERREKSL